VRFAIPGRRHRSAHDSNHSLSRRIVSGALSLVKAIFSFKLLQVAFPQCGALSGRIRPDKSASVYRWREVAIAIAASASVTAERMRHLIADFDSGPKSASGKSAADNR
jgi:hypothetical protein